MGAPSLLMQQGWGTEPWTVTPWAGAPSLLMQQGWGTEPWTVTHGCPILAYAARVGDGTLDGDAMSAARTKTRTGAAFVRCTECSPSLARNEGWGTRANCINILDIHAVYPLPHGRGKADDPSPPGSQPFQCRTRVSV
jgi:hypothetical protein